MGAVSSWCIFRVPRTRSVGTTAVASYLVPYSPLHHSNIRCACGSKLDRRFLVEKPKVKDSRKLIESFTVPGRSEAPVLMSP